MFNVQVVAEAIVTDEMVSLCSRMSMYNVTRTFDVVMRLQHDE